MTKVCIRVHYTGDECDVSRIGETTCVSGDSEVGKETSDRPSRKTRSEKVETWSRQLCRERSNTYCIHQSDVFGLVGMS